MSMGMMVLPPVLISSAVQAAAPFVMGDGWRAHVAAAASYGPSWTRARSPLSQPEHP
jgi:hypothetical protein